MKKEYIINKPECEKNGMEMWSPGLKIRISNDKSLIEFETYYVNELTGYVGIRTKHHSKGDELDRVIEILNEIRSKI
jgi:hypothetical protein